MNFNNPLNYDDPRQPNIIGRPGMGQGFMQHQGINPQQGFQPQFGYQGQPGFQHHPGYQNPVIINRPGFGGALPFATGLAAGALLTPGRVPPYPPYPYQPYPYPPTPYPCPQYPPYQY
jgi:hypothetical protein